MSQSVSSWWLLPHRVNARWWAYVLVVIGAYWLLGKFGFMLASIDVASSVWLPSGLSIALIFLGGWRYAGLVFAADLLLELTGIVALTGEPLLAALAKCLLFALGNVAEALLACWLWRRLAPETAFSSARSVALFFLLAAPAGAAVSALFGSSALHWLNGLPLMGALVHWWAGDLLGASLLAPVLIIASRNERWSAVERRESLYLLVVTAVLVVLCFLPARSINFLLLPLFLPLIATAIWRLPDLATALLLLLVGGAAAVVTALDQHDVASTSRFVQLLLLKEWLLLGACTSYFALAFVRERKRLLRELSRYNLELEQQIDERTQALQQTSGRLQQVLDALPHFVWAKNRQGQFVLVNRALAQVYGLTPVQMQGITHASLHGESALLARLQAQESAVIDTGCASLANDFVIEREGETAKIYEVRTVPMYEQRTQNWLSLSIGVDVTIQKNILQQAEHLALHDALTGLANRRLFFQQIQDELKRIRRQKTKAALLYLDLDGFKPVNDIHGHDEGDKVLQQIALRLSKAVREQDVVARLGGDEFAILLTQIHDESEAIVLAEKLLAVVAEPVIVAGLGLDLSVSIGVALLPADGERPDPLLSNADAAMYRAKQAGKNRYMRFTPVMQKLDAAVQAHDDSLRAALNTGAIQVYWQPIYWLPERRLLGVEALLRWQQDEQHLLKAAEFIDAAEQGGAVPDLSLLVWQQVQWLSERLCTDIFINVSSKQLADPQFLQRLQAWPLVRRQRLVLDIAERYLTQFNEAQLQRLRECHGLGVRLCVDDCSIAALMWMRWRQLPLWAIKISQRTLQNLPGAGHSAGKAATGSALNASATDSTLTSILALAANLKVVVLAGAIESDHLLEPLVSAGVEGGQGWALGLEQTSEQLLKTAAG